MKHDNDDASKTRRDNASNTSGGHAEGHRRAREQQEGDGRATGRATGMVYKVCPPFSVFFLFLFYY